MPHAVPEVSGQPLRGRSLRSAAKVAEAQQGRVLPAAAPCPRRMQDGKPSILQASPAGPGPMTALESAFLRRGDGGRNFLHFSPQVTSPAGLCSPAVGASPAALGAERPGQRARPGPSFPRAVIGVARGPPASTPPRSPRTPGRRAPITPRKLRLGGRPAAGPTSARDTSLVTRLNGCGVGAQGPGAGERTRFGTSGAQTAARRRLARGQGKWAWSVAFLLLFPSLCF